MRSSQRLQSGVYLGVLALARLRDGDAGVAAFACRWRAKLCTGNDGTARMVGRTNTAARRSEGVCAWPNVVGSGG